MAKGFIQLKFSERSLNKFYSDLRRFDTTLKTGNKKVLRETAKNIMAQSQSEVPRETNTLADAAYIEQPREERDRISITLGYGGPKDKRNPATGKMASEYALIQHETPGTPPGGGNYHPYGKWKFLEDPVIAHSREFDRQLEGELDYTLNMWRTW